MIEWTPVTQAFVALIAAVITVVGTYFAKWLNTKITDEQQSEIFEWVSIAVVAAEQMYQGNGRGKEKFEYVIKFIKDRGVKWDDSKLRALIEATVWEKIG